MLGLLSLAPAASGQDEELLPDLTAEPVNQVKLCQEMVGAILNEEACQGTGTTVLRLDNRVGNYGNGPLELRADFAAEAPVSEGGLGEDCHGDGDVDLEGDGIDGPVDNDVWLSQATAIDTNDNGVFDRGSTEVAGDAWAQRVAGCRYYHPEHYHYHLENFARYQLLAERTWNKASRVVRKGSKVSFCVEDTNSFAGGLGLPGAPQESFYDGDLCRQRDSLAGVSIGWFDHYGWILSGQQIDVKGLRAGTYCLRTIVDPPQPGKPNGQLEESDETNNSRAVRVYIDPSRAPVNMGRNTPDVQQLKKPNGQLQSCRLGPPKRLSALPR
ncbi:hypothetical protein HJD18_06910 [Thermoleophilia bacterium SCSIO 60948]|nr:hypothetical protein HJD18_06910 [Thermoleophilia bacterium SCSIO 60948]